MDDGEIDLLRKTVTGLISSHDGDQLTRDLDDFGWLDLLGEADSTAIPIVFTALGRYGKWSSALNDVLLNGLGLLGNPGDRETCVVLPWPRQETPGRQMRSPTWIEGFHLGGQADFSNYAVPTMDENGTVTIVVVAAEHLEVSRNTGLDPDLGVFSISGETRSVGAVAGGATALWRHTEAVARIALSHQLVGSMQTMLELGLEHARTRAQFGRPIGTFQAVRQRLAESHVAVAAADAAATAAWDAGDDLDLAAATAKLVTSRAVATVAAHIQQVLAGIGFTTEHDFHRYMKRAAVLDRILGSSNDLASAVGAELITRARAPRLVEL